MSWLKNLPWQLAELFVVISIAAGQNTTLLLARGYYSASLESVFFFAACSTLLAYLVRLPVCPFHYSCRVRVQCL